MPISHLLLALAVVAVWGSNFVVIKFGLAELPPFALATLRFALSALPWALFIRRPAVAWWRLAAFGVLLGCGQFGLLFQAMRSDISPGLASLVVQAQVFFTIALSLLFSGERVRLMQVLAALLALAGMGWIGWHGLQGSAEVHLLGLLLVLAAALCWAAANLVARSAGRVDALGFMVWSSLFAVPPLALISATLEGVAPVWLAVQHASGLAWAAVIWQALGNTLFGYGSWNWLLARHPAATVTPMALLVPVFGFGSSALLLGEPLPGWKLAAAGLVMAGLGLNFVATRRA
ncbi:MAG: EamA family transporter [Burkholderiales bacterium]|nr:EamA family transporter [Burkholderiales bacterium]